MANNYQQFSEQIEGLTKRQALRLVEILAKLGEENETTVCAAQVEKLPGRRRWGVWMYAEEFGEPFLVIEAVARLQEEFGLKEPWTINYAVTCSKMRIGEFGGGQYTAYRGDVIDPDLTQVTDDELRRRGWKPLPER